MGCSNNSKTLESKTNKEDNDSKQINIQENSSNSDNDSNKSSKKKSKQ